MRIFWADVAEFKSAEIVRTAEKKPIVNFNQLRLAAPLIDARYFSIDQENRIPRQMPVLGCFDIKAVNLFGPADRHARHVPAIDNSLTRPREEWIIAAIVHETR